MSRPPLDPDLARALHALQGVLGVDQVSVVCVLPAAPGLADPAVADRSVPAVEQASLLGPSGEANTDA
jgi:hypothetical protein